MWVNNLENILLKASSLEKTVISYIYSQMFINTPNFGSRTFWAEDFGCQVDNKKWQRILLKAKKITSSNSTYETQYKIIHRLHVTPAVRTIYDPMCSGQCVKCKNILGTYSHLIWFCPKISQFWLTVKSELVKVFGIQIQLNPINCILGLDSD